MMTAGKHLQCSVPFRWDSVAAAACDPPLSPRRDTAGSSQQEPPPSRGPEPATSDIETSINEKHHTSRSTSGVVPSHMLDWPDLPEDAQVPAPVGPEAAHPGPRQARKFISLMLISRRVGSCAKRSDSAGSSRHVVSIQAHHA